MLNALWLNAQELNGSGQLQKVVALAANETAGATADPPILYRRRGLLASVTGGATPTVGLFRRRSLRSNASAGAVADDGNYMSPVRRMYAQAFILTDSLLGAQFDVFLAADVTAGATALMYPYEVLFEAEVSAGAIIDVGDDPELVKIRQFGGSVACGADVDDSPVFANRRAFAVANVLVRGIGNPDTIVDEKGTPVRYAELATDLVLGADAECVIDPTKLLRAEAVVLTGAVASNQVNRYVEFRSNPQLAGATANFPSLRGTVTVLGAPVTAGVPSTLVSLYRTARLSPAAAEAGAKINALPRLRASRYLYAENLATATAVPPLLLHYRGLGASVLCGAPMAYGDLNYAEKLYGEAIVYVDAAPPTVREAIPLESEILCGISGVADVDVKLAIKLAAEATAGADVDPAPYFTYRELRADATIDIDADGAELQRTRTLRADAETGAVAVGTVWINLYDPEPDFRTYEVEPEDWSNPIEPEDWSFAITDDSGAMKTFTKQPGETLGYDIDFRPWFEQIPGDEIDSADCVVVSATSGSPSDLTIVQVVRMTDNDEPALSNPGLRSSRVKVWLSNGIDGATYKLTLTIETEDGRIKEVDFKLKVKEV